MEWYIDANVLVKAVTEETLSEEATALMSDALTMEIRLIAPHPRVRGDQRCCEESGYGALQRSKG